MHRPGMARYVLALLVMLWPSLALAAMQAVKPEKVPVLGPGDGLVVMAVDTPVDLYQVRVNRDGKVWGDGVMADLGAGQNYRLYVAPAGDYQWRELMLVYGLRYALKDDGELKFKVKAGVINYPGDLLFQPTSLWRAQIRSANRGLAAIDWLQQNHPALYARHAFVYSGLYPDPFPDFYRQAQREHAAAATPVPPPATADPPAGLFWRKSRILRSSLNPSGNLLALQIRGEKQDWHVEMLDLEHNTFSKVATGDMPLSGMQWAGDQALLSSIALSGGRSRVSVIRADADGDGKQHYSHFLLPGEGSVLDTLPAFKDQILYATQSREGELMVHRVDISSKRAAEAFRPNMRTRLNTGAKGDAWWFADADGTLRLGVVLRGQDYVLVNAQGTRFADVMTLSDEIGFEPVAISADASKVYGLTDKDRAQRDLVEYDVASNRISRTLFSQAGIDIVAPLFDDRRNVIGASYYREGQLVSEYFQKNDAHVLHKLIEAFPGQTVEVIERSRDGRQLVARLDSSDQPPRLYHLDTNRATAALIDDEYPWLQGRTFAATHVVKLQASDGLQLEAFLTLPEAAAPRPLIVFPHGGPIGVADRLHFDNEVQFLAAQGYAVLRVNFRGSEGYGRAFREAGHRGYGTRIEDDIDAAINTVLARYPLDPARMCILGSSYGGYSALISAVRWPQRFRCAVSIAGVSDRLLFFTASDSGGNQKSRELMEKLMGNPNQDAEQMQASSPLYQYQQLTLPILLAHGRKDARVDFEHSRRMARLLALAQHPPRELYFDDEGHGITSSVNQTRLWDGISEFLRQNLQP